MEDEVCASERRSDKPLGEAWLQARPLGMRGGGHRSVFYAVRRAVKKLGLDVVYSGDIGCYSLAVNKPFNARDGW